MIWLDNKFASFRNRIFHQETTWHFADSSHAHDDIMETIGWMSPEMRQVVGIVDDLTPLTVSKVAARQLVADDEEETYQSSTCLYEQ